MALQGVHHAPRVQRWEGQKERRLVWCVLKYAGLDARRVVDGALPALDSLDGYLFTLRRRGAGFVTKEAFMEVLIERAQAGTLRTLQPHGSGPAPAAAGAAGAGGSGVGAVPETPGSPVGPSGPSGVGRPGGEQGKGLGRQSGYGPVAYF